MDAVKSDKAESSIIDSLVMMRRGDTFSDATIKAGLLDNTTATAEDLLRTRRSGFGALQILKKRTRTLKTKLILYNTVHRQGIEYAFLL